MISYNKLCEKHNRILYTTILFTLYSAPPSAYARSAHARLCPAPARAPVLQLCAGLLAYILLDHV